MTRAGVEVRRGREEDPRPSLRKGLNPGVCLPPPRGFRWRQLTTRSQGHRMEGGHIFP